jgi:hypothetical protein
MPRYLVTIALSGRSPSDIKKKVSTAFGPSVAMRSSVTAVGELPIYDLCRSNDHFGCVHWTDEDLVARLKELKTKATPELLDSIKSTYACRHVADRMIETGWEIIDEAIADSTLT